MFKSADPSMVVERMFPEIVIVALPPEPTYRIEIPFVLEAKLGWVLVCEAIECPAETKLLIISQSVPDIAFVPSTARVIGIP